MAAQTELSDKRPRSKITDARATDRARSTGGKVFYFGNRGAHTSMEEAYVRLLCPSCAKGWESNPSELPHHDATFECPDCGETRMLAEFMRTDHDLQTLKQLR